MKFILEGIAFIGFNTPIVSVESLNNLLKPFRLLRFNTPIVSVESVDRFRAYQETDVSIHQLYR